MFKIYVGNLDYKVKVEQLRELFGVYAPIEDLVIPLDERTNRAKGFAIVMIRDTELGQAAVKAMQGKRLLGRLLVVNEAVKRKKIGQPVLTKADLVRNGPFGPRMFRTGDARTRTSRNPRRGQLSGGATGTGQAVVGQPIPPEPSATPSATASATGAVVTQGADNEVTQGSDRSAARATSTGASTVVASVTSSAARAQAPAARTASAAKPAAPAAVASPPAAPVRLKAQRLATPKRPSAEVAPDQPQRPSGG